jgi:hypothetical protein
VIVTFVPFSPRDDVAREDPQAIGRAAFDRGDDDDVVALLLDLHAHAEVLAGVILAHPGEARGVEEVRVGVEGIQRPPDRGHGQGLLVERLVVARFEDAGDRPGLAQGGRPEVLVMRRDREDDENAEDQVDEPFFHRLHFPDFSTAPPLSKEAGGR